MSEKSSPPSTSPLSTFEKILNILKIAFGLIGSVVTVALFLTYIFGNSKTSVAFVSADPDVIHVRLTNEGWKPSTLRGYRLTFPDLPFDAAPLELVMADQQKGRVPRLRINFEEKFIEDGSLDLGLIVGGVNCRVPGLSDEQIKAMLQNGHATVEIDVQEAKDPPQGPWQERSDTVPATQMEFLIMKKIR